MPYSYAEYKQITEAGVIYLVDARTGEETCLWEEPMKPGGLRVARLRVSSDEERAEMTETVKALKDPHGMQAIKRALADNQANG